MNAAEREELLKLRRENKRNRRGDRTCVVMRYPDLIGPGASDAFQFHGKSWSSS